MRIGIGYISRLNSKTFRLLEKRGCSRLTFGVESGSKRISDLINKKMSPKKTLDLNKRLKDYEIIANYNFMSGFPTETLDDLRKKVKLLLRLLEQNKNATVSNILIYMPYSGTDLYSLALKEGLKPPQTLDGLRDYNTTTANLPWLTKKRKRLIESLSICSLFFDKKSEELNASAIIRLLARIYRPIAKTRVKNMFFKFMVEEKFYKFFTNNLGVING